MLKVLLGVSITINVISMIIFFIIYKYSLKDFIKGIKKYSLNNFIGSNFDIEDMFDEKYTEGDIFDN